MGDAAKDVTRTHAALGGLLVVLAASGAAWALAYPQAAPAQAVVRAVADCAAAVTLGLATAPALEDGRHRTELMHRAEAPLAVAAGVWLVAELCRLVVGAAAAAAMPVTRVGLGTALEFASATAVGRSGVFSAAAAGVVLLLAVAAPRTAPVTVAVAGVTAVGLVARTIGGHMAASALGGAAIAVHALTAALWCGTLAALVLTVEHRGQWARVLPRFSELSLGCVIALLAGGVAGALVVIGSPSQLFGTGYGRVLLIKIVLTVVLLALAWSNRARWLPAAKSHRVTAYLSRSRSLTELAIMTVALTMAAALSVTG
ncbi:copper resistance protein D [Mycolicibacterium agri]|uniref:Copper resistance protein D n=1 Tax=Mycolicibacterium agri TaxID=36811 RepID=A0A7I9W7S3_MYCAG|nr:copper resistance protein D [Mycolicibacterium agri]